MVIWIWFQDEAGTSAEAKRVLHDVYGVVSLGDQKRRGSDRMAACMILQRFLDHFNTARTARARAFSPKLNANTPDFALHMAMAMQMQASGRRSDGAQALLDRLPRDDPYVILPAREARQ
jgi:thioredoxin-like negative regulator of GroEL